MTKPWPKVKLGDILDYLPKQAQDDVLKVVNSKAGLKDMPGKLIPLLTPYREVLEGKGVVPEFLAYAITHVVITQRGQ
jgi:hypothetical protein